MARSRINIFAPVTAGELVDKITILTIKKTELQKAEEKEQLTNVEHELHELSTIFTQQLLPKIADKDEFQKTVNQLEAVNKTMWDLQDAIRKFGHNNFDAIAKTQLQIISTNDQRVRLKNKINELSGTLLREQKAYGLYLKPGQSYLKYTVGALGVALTVGIALFAANRFRNSAAPNSSFSLKSPKM